MADDLCSKIVAGEMKQFIDECVTGEDRVAYLPSKPLPHDRLTALTALREIMLADLGERLGYRASSLEGFDEREAFIVTDRAGRTAVWVAGDFRRYKLAYRRFWRIRLGLDIDPEIQGKIWHVDHAFNRARIVASLRGRHERSIVEGGRAVGPNNRPKFLGYVRLFLIPAAVNRAWGASIERIRTMEADGTVTGHGASYLIMAKLIGALPPKDMADVRQLAILLKASFGINDLAVDDLFYLIGDDTRRLEGISSIWSMISVDGQFLDVYDAQGNRIHRSDKDGLARSITDIDDLINYVCETGAGLDRPFSPGETGAIQRILCEEGTIFAAFLHHVMRWPIARVGKAGSAWHGVITPSGEMADARGVQTREQICYGYGIPRDCETSSGDWEMLDGVLWLNSAPYATFGQFWMCWLALSCLPRNPFQEVAMAYPTECTVYDRGLSTADGEIVPWWPSRR